MNDDYATLTDARTLEENRAGRMTELQRVKLEHRGRGCAFIALPIMLFFGAAFVVPALLATGIIGGVGNPSSSLCCASPLLLIGGALIAVGLYSPVGILRTQRRTRSEVAMGLVASGEGWVAYTRRGYMARMEWTQAIAGAGAKYWQHGRPVNLPPGRYRFYYLPQSGRLLSAEPLDGQAPLQVMLDAGAFAPPPAPAPDPLAGLPGYTPTPLPGYSPAGYAPAPSTGGYGGYAGQGGYASSSAPLPAGALGALQAALAEGLRFTMEDLALNQMGRLGPQQERQGRASLCLLVPFGLCFGGIGVATVVENGSTGSLALPAVIFALFFILVPIGLLATLLRNAVEVQRGYVTSLEGVVTRYADTSGENNSYYYVLGGKRFTVSNRAYDALVSGLRYRLYYLPRSKRVMSAEPLGV